MKTKHAMVVSIVLALCGAGTSLAGESKVEKVAQHSKILLEHLVSGHLTKLNGKFKQLRITETVYDAGGYIGIHHHAGPGIRLVASGELTYVEMGKTTVYKTGDYFYESGDMTHSAYNNIDQPVRVIDFELLPADGEGFSAIPAPAE